MTAVSSGLNTPAAPPDPATRKPWARLGQLVDTGSIEPLHPVDSSGVLAVRATVEGSPVVAYCADATQMDVEGCRHTVAAIDTAVRLRCPVVGVWHGGGSRPADGVDSLHAVGEVFAAMVWASGRVPQLSVVVGAAAVGLALTDVVITAAAEQDVFPRARRVTRLLGEQGSFAARSVPADEGMRRRLPSWGHDVKPLVRRILDDDVFDELQTGSAPSVVVGLGRLNGRTVGVVASNPVRHGGCLDALSAEKAARFVRMCDSFGVPLVVVADVAGHTLGAGQESAGAKLLHAFAEAVVPRVTLVTRKVYGDAYIAMNSRALGATAVFAWPGADVAVPGGLADAVTLGVVDEVIDPRLTRQKLAVALAEAVDRRGSHGNIPL
jgi:acetyl-CoA/propionyl-CoA carboxylase carboxyl transferase subunit